MPYLPVQSHCLLVLSTHTYLFITNFIREIEEEGMEGSSLSCWIDVVSKLRLGAGGHANVFISPLCSGIADLPHIGHDATPTISPPDPITCSAPPLMTYLVEPLSLSLRQKGRGRGMGLKPRASYSFHSFHRGKEVTGVCHTCLFNPIAYSSPPLITYLLFISLIRERQKDGWRGGSPLHTRS